ncbi:hypothetical protein EYC80_004005 [Monilinia laxa]|uniref:Uncharacterized protein n=1 Tax=Monilinia laxa TaxID=61186 RepID=A0A5N6KLS5_MONLA|nr:hypothetical protein EYC80_004005 [Monilinia laxa]
MYHFHLSFLVTLVVDKSWRLIVRFGGEGVRQQRGCNGYTAGMCIKIGCMIYYIGSELLGSGLLGSRDDTTGVEMPVSCDGRWWGIVVNIIGDPLII